MTQDTPVSLDNASLDWDAAGLPRSRHYGDIYFSGADALGESTHVFLQGNLLQERWRGLQEPCFVVAELGFGAGLNFLNTCRLWCAQVPPERTLHYVACELHPLLLADMQRLHALWPELQYFSSRLLAVYPDHTPGIHQCELSFGQHNVVLTLLYGDAHTMLQALYEPHHWRVDAWFLDGFTPKLNPALWEPQLLTLLARFSKASTTLTTYSVAGSFRQGLLEAGFTYEKLQGYAGKRHMLRATLERDPGETALASKPGQVCIIGGGLAGCATAHALAQSGWEVVLLEREAALATQGSGNLQGILHCKPGKLDTLVNRLNMQAYLHATRHYRALAQEQALPWHACGMLQVAVTPELEKRFRELAASGLYPPQMLRLVEADEAGHLAGTKLEHPALYFAGAGWVSPPVLCSLYTKHPKIHVRTGADVSRLEQQSGGWLVHFRQDGTERTLAAERVVLCNSLDMHTFAQTRHYPVIGNRGQVDLYAGNEATQLQAILCGQGYVLPRWQGQQSLGGSYFVGDGDASTRNARRMLHLRQLQALNPAVAEQLRTQEPVSQRSATRCILPDRLPLSGLACSEQGTPWPGLYLNVAHGSHGLTRTPLCAALLASMINRSPPPLAPALAALLAPARCRTRGAASAGPQEE